MIRYIEDRRENGERWTQVLETTDVPLTFVWGMLDPVSGAHMAERIRERLPDAPFTALEDVAHWPPLEGPERVVAALLGVALSALGASRQRPSLLPAVGNSGAARERRLAPWRARVGSPLRRCRAGGL